MITGGGHGERPLPPHILKLIKRRERQEHYGKLKKQSTHYDQSVAIRPHTTSQLGGVNLKQYGGFANQSLGPAEKFLDSNYIEPPTGSGDGRFTWAAGLLASSIYNPMTNTGSVNDNFDTKPVHFSLGAGFGHASKDGAAHSLDTWDSLRAVSENHHYIWKVQSFCRAQHNTLQPAKNVGKSFTFNAKH